MQRFFLLLAALMFAASVYAAEPVRLVLDTDLGNDVDDAMALAVVHALENRNECKLLAITTTKDNPYVAPMIDLLNTFYGRPEIPIAVVKNGMTKDDGKYNRQVLELKDDEGKPRYPRTLTPEAAANLPDAVPFLRKLLANEPDNSVVLLQIGFFTNYARLLDTPADDISPLTGKELIAKKVKLLSLMAGSFNSSGHKEYNVVIDIPSAKKLVSEWPTEMVFSGFEIGETIQHPPASMKEDYGYVKHHPLQDAYHFYRGLDNWQPTFDLSSVIYAVRPNRGYFDLSGRGTVSVLDDGRTVFTPGPNGKHRYMIVNPAQIAMVREAFVQLCSEPPKAQQLQGRARGIEERVAVVPPKDMLRGKFVKEDGSDPGKMRVTYVSNTLFSSRTSTFRMEAGKEFSLEQWKGSYLTAITEDGSLGIVYPIPDDQLSEFQTVELRPTATLKLKLLAGGSPIVDREISVATGSPWGKGGFGASTTDDKGVAVFKLPAGMVGTKGAYFEFYLPGRVFEFDLPLFPGQTVEMTP
jgi:inosine-uridine nucleoside N-ribohydrolase